MDHIDSKFIGLLSSRLEKFKRVKSNLYNFRCPICGDSKKNKNKTRGYLYSVKANTNFKCHNCGSSMSLNNLLKKLDPTLHKQYTLEKFKSVSLQLSIDSVGKRNDFLRSGSDWKTVEQVADFWFNFKSENPKSVNVAICTTVSIFNILTLDQLFKWLIEKEKEHSIFIDIYFVVLQSPKYMAIFNFSKKHKEQIKQVISQIPGKPRQTLKLIKMLDNAVPTTISARKDLKDTTDHIDVIRSEDWKQVFPEVFKLIYG